MRSTLTGILLCLACAAPAVALAQAGTIETYAGGGQSLAEGTPLRELDLRGGTALAVDRKGRVHVAVPGRILRLGGGIGQVVAGDGTPGFSGDGGPARQARIGRVGAIAFDLENRLLFADQDALRVRRIEHDGTITTVAGNGENVDETYTIPVPPHEAGMTRPMGLAVRHDGLVYVSTEGHYVRCFTPGVNIGNCHGVGFPATAVGGSPNSPGLWSPGALAFSPTGSLYVADNGNKRIRRFDPDGITVQTEVGTGAHLEGGNSFSTNAYDGLAFDGYGRLFFSVKLLNRIYARSAATVPDAWVGTGVAGYSGDGGPGLYAQLDAPGQIAIAADRTMYVLDQAGAVVRRVAAPPAAGGPPAVPGVPRVDPGEGEAFLTIIPPLFEGASPITAYEVETIPGGGQDTAAGTARTFRRIAGLDRFTEYTYRVRAINNQGAGPWSGPSLRTGWAEQVATELQVTPMRRTVQEGDSGFQRATYRGTLNRALPDDLLFDVELMPEYGGVEGVDLVTSHLRDVRVPAGSRAVLFDVLVPGDELAEDNTAARLRIGNFRGADVGFEPQVWLSILDDDGGTAPPETAFRAVDDQFTLVPEAGPHVLDVVANDHWEGTDAWNVLFVATRPMQGSLEARRPDTEATGDARLVYTPNPGARGDDYFSYRLSNGLEDDEAWVRVRIQPFDDIDLDVDAQAGHADVDRVIGWEQSAAAFSSTPLAGARVHSSDAAETAAGRMTERWTIPADPQAPARRIYLLIDARGADADRPFELRAGTDDNQNQQADAVEVRCVAAMAGRERQRCLLHVDLEAGAGGMYWAEAAYLDGGAGGLVLEAFEIPDMPSDGSLAVTAPPRLVAGETASLRIGWNDATLLPGGARAGLVRMSEDGRPLGEFAVRLDANAASAVPTSLVPGRIHRLSLPAGGSHGASFIDVPEGTSRLRVIVRSASDVDLTLTPVPANAPDRPHLADFPDPAQAPHVAGGAGGNHMIERTAPAAGRWFIGLRHGPFSSAAASAEIEVQLEGMAPAVRPGSYFNPARGGHGLFLYPAGNQLTGLWYTYLEDGSPTWYYLQGPAPGANGLWAGGIYRSTWLGDRNALVQVGQATASPTAPDAFQFSYQVDGRSGTEPLSSLGRGCPTLSGSPLDASSQWFDPRQAGTGYSVQLWPDYEFYAAFVYDAQGMARFLTAEAGDFLGEQGFVPVQQLQDGPCPACDDAGLPVRTSVGGLVRRFANGSLQWLDLDAVMRGKAKGDWSRIHTVQPLGGPGTTQGCDP